MDMMIVLLTATESEYLSIKKKQFQRYHENLILYWAFIYRGYVDVIILCIRRSIDISQT